MGAFEYQKTIQMETIKRTKIVDVLKSDAFGTTVNVKGWVRTRRGSKQVNFIALNDGSTINNVQIVVDVDKLGDEFLKPITTGASISVNGILTQSQGKGQNVEIQATEIEIFGTADPATYPLQKKGHSMEFLREIAHLRRKHHARLQDRTYLGNHGSSDLTGRGKSPKPPSMFLGKKSLVVL